MTINQFICSVLAITATLLCLNISVKGQKLPNPADLISFENPQELAISPDGNTVIVKTKKANIENNSYQQSYWRLSTDNKTTAKKVPLPADATSIQWFPEGNKIAYISRADRRKQIWVKDLPTDSVQQVTEERGGVKSFSISPDGKTIAYTTVDARAMAKARKRSNTENPKGKEIDLLTFSAHQITNNRLTLPTQPRVQLRIFDLKTGDVQKITDSVSVRQLSWSPSGNKIAFSALETSVQSKGIPKRASSLFIYDMANNESKVIKKGSQGEKNIFDGVITYVNPFWSPSGDKLGYLRKDFSDRWSSIAEIGVYNQTTENEKIISSKEDQEFYGAEFFWFQENKIYAEYTRRAKRGLFRISVKDGNSTPINVSDSVQKNFSFSTDGNQVAWINSSISKYPEVFTSDNTFNNPKKISSIHKDSKNLRYPEVKSIQWNSKDGTQVQGWYITPKENKKENPPPVITLLHGGPGIPVTNSFQPYMQQWPYPIQTLTARGYTIFIPNYRGTSSFGKSFKEPTKPDKEPINDVITGINYLIKKGLAHEDKLGIMGHSHGGWLGPMVAAEKPIFKAASFAEGGANYLSLYGHQAGYMGKELYEYHIGSTPYENTDRYIELSPAFKDSLTTQIPTLLEFGQQSPVAIQGVEFAKAFWRHETPHKLIIYPNEGHSIRSPKMQVDAMKRNIEWFEKWLPTDK